MAKVIQFKRKPSTNKDYFKYATHTGLCPKCGSKLEIIYTCNCCKTTTVMCSCGLHIERRL